MNVRYKECDCVVEVSQYGNGRPAIMLRLDTGEVVAKATVNVPIFAPIDGEVLIDDHNENQGILKCLSDAKILETSGQMLYIGNKELHICKLLVA